MDQFRKMAWLRAGAIIAMSCLALVTSASAIQITENFDVDPLWDSFNNTTGNSNFGFSNTNNVGLGAGEVGGAIGNPGPSKGFYADDIGSLDPSNQSLSMKGTLWTDVVPTASDGQSFWGWFDKDSIGSNNRPNNFIGLYTLRDPPYQLRLVWQVDGNSNEVAFLTNLTDTTAYTYDVTYDPSANSGNGRITALINGGAAGSATISLGPGRKDAFSSFDRFGLVSENPGISSSPVMVFHDNIMYTTGIPEPASAMLLCLGLGLVTGHRRVPRKR